MIAGRESRPEERARLPRCLIRLEGGWKLTTLFFCIILLAIGLRAVAGLRFDPVTFDSAVYFEMADRFLAGRWSEGMAYPYPPLYPLLIAGIQRFALTAESAGLLIATAADLLLLFPLVAVARTAMGERTAWGAAFLWAIHPLAIRLGVQALTDAPTAFFVALALWAGLRALDECSLAWAVGAGVASGLAYLLRPEGMEPALALAALYALRGDTVPRRDRGSPTPHSTARLKPSVSHSRVLRRIAWATAPLAGWLIVASPYLAYISVETGSITLSKKKSPSGLLRSLALPPADEGFPQQKDEQTTREATGGFQSAEKRATQAVGVRQPPSQSWFRRMAKSMYVFQKPLVNGVNPLVLFLGFLAAANTRSRKVNGSSQARALLVSLLGLHFGILMGLAAEHGAVYLGGHHFFLMVVYALPFAGAALAWTLPAVRERLHAPRWVPILALGLVVGGTLTWMLTRGADRGVMVRPAAAWIRAQAVGTPVIVTNIAKLTYHAKAERVELRGTYDDILCRGRARFAQFVAFYPNLLPSVSPDFLTRLNPSDLELVTTFPEPSRSAPDQRLEIYRLRPRR